LWPTTTLTLEKGPAVFSRRHPSRSHRMQPRRLRRVRGFRAPSRPVTGRRGCETKI
jgi:hypothetical protein